MPSQTEKSRSEAPSDAWIFSHERREDPWPTARLPANPTGSSVYRLRVSDWLSWLGTLEDILDAAERVRADRYAWAADRQRFVVRRAVLRLVLGRLTDSSAPSIHFSSYAQHKPCLVEFPDLHFNVSHTHDWILIAVGNRPLGVDVETIDPAFGYGELLADCFSAAEGVHIGTGTGSRRRFYELWTRKEALLKGTGQGISEAMAQLPILTGQHAFPASFGMPETDWTVVGFEVSAETVGALAYGASPAHAGRMDLLDLLPSTFEVVVGGV